MNEISDSLSAAVASLRGADDLTVTACIVRCLSTTAPDTDPTATLFAINAVVAAIREAARQDAIAELTVPGLQ